MAPLGSRMTDDEIWHMVNYIKTLGALKEGGGRYSTPRGRQRVVLADEGLRLPDVGTPAWSCRPIGS